MRSAEECRIQASAMHFPSLIATTIVERDEYSALEQAWLGLAKASQDSLGTFIPPAR